MVKLRSDVIKDGTIADLVDERIAQADKWGQQDHPNGTGDKWAKHAADWARQDCDQAFAKGHGTWRHIMEEEIGEAFAESDPAMLRAELVQVIAVGAAWIEAIDRKAVNDG